MKNKKIFFKIFLEFLVLTLVVGFFANDVIKITYATITDEQPNVTITIDERGGATQNASLFGDELWYPGKSHSGVIRISNQYQRIKVSNLGIGFELKSTNGRYNEDIIKASFLDNMKLTIKKGKLLAMDKTIVDDKSLGELLNGYSLDTNDQFYINKGDFIDLEYTLKMDEKAGDELEGISVNLPFYINVNESTIDYDDDDDRDREGTRRYEQQSIIPTIGAHWAHDCIIALLNHGIIQGYPHEEMTIEDYRNGTVDPVIYVYEAVKPERYITRAEAAMLLGKALGLEEETAAITGYIDSIPDWARGYIIATTKAEIFEGYPFRLFKANKFITREEMIAVLVRAFELKLEDEGYQLTFEDKEEIAEWAENFVKAGCENKVIEGYPDNTYRPKNYITRAEAFTIICKLLGYHGEHTITLD